MAKLNATELGVVFEKHSLPFALITKPEDLFDDPRLMATGGLAPVIMPDGSTTRAPLMPVMLGGARLGVRLNPPRIGEHTDALLAELGYSGQQILAMKETRIAKST